MLYLILSPSRIYSKLAIETAGKAFETWQHSTPGVRSAVIKKAAELLCAENYNQRVTDTIVQETGATPIWAALSNLLSQSYMMSWVDAPYQVKGEICPSDNGNQVFVKKRPMGVMWVPRTTLHFEPNLDLVNT